MKLAGQVNPQNRTTSFPKIWAIVPAAGLGARMGGTVPKQYLELQGKSIIRHSVEKLLGCDAVAGVAVGIVQDDPWWKQCELEHQRLLGTYTGGVERVHTVLNGVEYLSPWTHPQDWIMVHDAVRPCVSHDEINLLIEKGLQSDSGALLAIRVIDTVKQINRQNKVTQTVNRNELMLAQTPQLFPLPLLKRALHHAIEKGELSTDESAAVEHLGEQPLVIEGRRNNIKITTAEDLPIAHTIIQNTESQ